MSNFEQLAAEAWERLPQEFRTLCEGVVIRIDDFATDEVLNSLGIESPFDLMGLYQGVSLDRKSVMDSGREPDMVFLYRRAILDYWAEGDEALGASRHACAGARNRPSFRLVGCGYGGAGSSGQRGTVTWAPRLPTFAQRHNVAH